MTIQKTQKPAGSSCVWPLPWQLAQPCVPAQLSLPLSRRCPGRNLPCLQKPGRQKRPLKSRPPNRATGSPSMTESISSWSWMPLEQDSHRNRKTQRRARWCCRRWTAWMLSRCNDPCNLITGTRAMNLAMVPYETHVADYIRATGGHVLYRAVPVFFEDELVCRGIRLEAMSLEDGGAGLHFNVFFHNVQPGISIDYRTGDSRLLEAAALPSEEDHEHEQTFIINESSKKFHTDSCPNAERIAPHNRRVVQDTRAGLKAQGYHDAGCCLDTGP